MVVSNQYDGYYNTSVEEGYIRGEYENGAAELHYQQVQYPEGVATRVSMRTVEYTQPPQPPPPQTTSHLVITNTYTPNYNV
ncbi:26231_t:CDS:1, partial [Dentiscutata erythropus]